MTIRFLLCAIVVLALAATVSAEQPAASCQEQLKLIEDLSSEFDHSRDTAVREKVVYKRAFENERARRLALEKQLAEIKAKLEPVEPKDDARK
jgi:outer membrane lipoprotein-sorting protein